MTIVCSFNRQPQGDLSAEEYACKKCLKRNCSICIVCVWKWLFPRSFYWHKYNLSTLLKHTTIGLVQCVCKLFYAGEFIWRFRTRLALYCLLMWGNREMVLEQLQKLWLGSCIYDLAPCFWWCKRAHDKVVLVEIFWEWAITYYIYDEHPALWGNKLNFMRKSCIFNVHCGETIWCACLRDNLETRKCWLFRISNSWLFRIAFLAGKK